MNKPLHTTVTERLRRMLFSDEYKEGDRLPTEPVLARQLGVSRATLREAFQQLESEGILCRKHGIGTFVQSSTPAITLNLSIPRSITVMIESLGFIAGTVDMKVTTETVFPDDIERLSVNPGSRIVRIERIRTVNGQPAAYTIDAIPVWVLKQYPVWDNRNNFSLIEHLTCRCGIKLKETKSNLIPLHNIKSVAEKLEIEPASHIFFFEGVDHDEDNVPVIFSREYFAPWIFRFSVGRVP